MITLADPISIPLSLDTPLYSQRTVLDGKEYTLRFDWNGREGRWYLSLYLSDTGRAIVRGLKVLADWPLLTGVTDVDKPPGILLASDNSPQGGEPPGFQDLGRRVTLLYFPLADT